MSTRASLKMAAAALICIGTHLFPSLVNAQTPAEGANESITLHIVPQQATDPSLPAGPDHFAWVVKRDPTQAKRHWPSARLLIFMPGAGGAAGNPPRDFQLIGAEAARIGYHAIVLAYKQDRGIEFYCPAPINPDCAFNARRKILDGTSPADRVAMTAAESIDSRLTKLLVYLDQQYPDEGWSAFLEGDGTPKWPQMTVSGQSFGAAQAMVIGMLRRVDRVVTFSGFGDAASGWVTIGETPSPKHFALIHKQDRFFAVACKAYLALELDRYGDFTGCGGQSHGGDSADAFVEASAGNFRGTHVLITNLPPHTSSADPFRDPFPHQSPTRDAVTPVAADGTPLLRNAWRYGLGGPQYND